MAITGIGTSNYFYDYSQISNASDSAMEHALDKIGEETSRAELMEACKEFEAYFIEQIYKGMEKTIMKAEDEESSTAGQYKEFFGDMQVQEYAKIATEQNGGIGLANQLYEQMKRNYGL